MPALLNPTIAASAAGQHDVLDMKMFVGAVNISESRMEKQA